MVTKISCVWSELLPGSYQGKETKTTGYSPRDPLT